MSDEVSVDIRDLMPGDGIVEDAESNGDVTSPVGDIDSEGLEDDPQASFGEEDASEDESPSDDLEDAETELGESQDEDPEDAADPQWLPGFEGRFRVGEEEKALQAYQELEKDYSRKDQKFQEDLRRERLAAIEEAKLLLAQQQNEPSWMDVQQERSQLIGYAYSDPAGAFDAAIQSGNTEHISAVIQAVAQGDPELGIDGDPGTALQMQSAVQQLQTQQAVQQQQSEIQQFRAEMAVKDAYHAFESQNRDLLDNEAFQTALRDVVAERNPYLDTSSKDTVSAFLNECADLAYGRLARQAGVAPGATSATTQQATTESKREAKKRGRVNTGNPARAVRETKPSAEDEVADDILAAARHLKPVF